MHLVLPQIRGVPQARVLYMVGSQLTWIAAHKNRLHYPLFARSFTYQQTRRLIVLARVLTTLPVRLIVDFIMEALEHRRMPYAQLITALQLPGSVRTLARCLHSEAIFDAESSSTNVFYI